MQIIKIQKFGVQRLSFATFAHSRLKFFCFQKPHVFSKKPCHHFSRLHLPATKALRALRSNRLNADVQSARSLFRNFLTVLTTMKKMKNPVARFFLLLLTVLLGFAGGTNALRAQNIEETQYFTGLDVQAGGVAPAALNIGDVFVIKDDGTITLTVISPTTLQGYDDYDGLVTDFYTYKVNADGTATLTQTSPDGDKEEVTFNFATGTAVHIEYSRNGVPGHPQNITFTFHPASDHLSPGTPVNGGVAPDSLVVGQVITFVQDGSGETTTATVISPNIFRIQGGDQGGDFPLSYVYNRAADGTSATVTLTDEGEVTVSTLNFVTGTYSRPKSDRTETGTFTLTAAEGITDPGTDDPGTNPGGGDTTPTPVAQAPALATKGVKLADAPAVPKGSSKATYEWYFTGANGVTTKIDKATKSTYTAKDYGDGTYTVRVTYTEKNSTVPRVETKSYAVNIVAAPKIAATNGFVISTPGATNTGVPNGVVQGETLTFTVTLEPGDTGDLNYIWIVDGKEFPRTLASHTDSFTLENVGASGKAPKVSVRVETVAKDAKGKPLSKVTSKAITPKLILPPTGAQLTAKPIVAGKTLTLTAKAKGTAKLIYTWYKEGNSTPLQSGTKASYSIRTATIADGGRYYVRVTNAQSASGDYYSEAFVDAVVSAAPVKAK
jgi:hypothetical protein